MVRLKGQVQKPGNLQNTLPFASIRDTSLDIRDSRFIHDIRADIMSPQIRCKLQPILKIPRMIRDHIHVTSPRTPVSKRLRLFEKGLDGGALERCHGCSNLVDGNL